MKRGLRMGKRRIHPCVSFRVYDPDRVISEKVERLKNLFSDVPASELYRMIFFQGIDSMERKMDEYAAARERQRILDSQPGLFDKEDL